jgi:AbrB family looped-hinge helix DNA binding protein
MTHTGASRQIVIPKKLHDALGLKAGDSVEVEIIEGNKLLVTPKEGVERHPEIDKRLADADEDIKYVMGDRPHFWVRTARPPMEGMV